MGFMISTGSSSDLGQATIKNSCFFDGVYLWVGDNSGNVFITTYDGTIFSIITTLAVSPYSIDSLYGDGLNVYATTGNGYLYALKYNNSITVSGSINIGAASHCLYCDSLGYVYVGTDSGPTLVVTFDGTNFHQIYSSIIHETQMITSNGYINSGAITILMCGGDTQNNIFAYTWDGANLNIIDKTSPGTGSNTGYGMISLGAYLFWCTTSSGLCCTTFADAKSLLHFNGNDGADVYTDETGLVWTNSGNSSLSTTSPKFGSACLKFQGSNTQGVYLSTGTIGNSSGFYGSYPDFYTADNDYTIEYWINTTAATDGTLYYQGDSEGNASTTAQSMYIQNSGKIWWTPDYVHYPSHHQILSTSSVNDGNWHHLACVKYNNDYTLYIDGIAEATTSIISFTNINSSYAPFLGILNNRNNGTGLGPYTGYIDEFRFTNGKARYTSNFVPQTSEFSLTFLSKSTFGTTFFSNIPGQLLCTDGQYLYVYNGGVGIKVVQYKSRTFTLISTISDTNTLGAVGNGYTYGFGKIVNGNGYVFYCSGNNIVPIKKVLQAQFSATPISGLAPLVVTFTAI